MPEGLILEGDQVHLTDQIPHGSGHVFGPTLRAIDPDLDLEFGYSLEVPRFVGGNQLISLLRRLNIGLEPVHGGPHQDERPDLLRVPQREFQHRCSPHRAP